MNLSAEQLKLIGSSSDPAELQEKLALEGVDISMQEATQLLEDYSFAELDPDDLDIASGGCGTPDDAVCAYCNQPISNSNFIKHSGKYYHGGCYGKAVN